MLGIRLSATEEQRLRRHAQEVGRPKSAIARAWIVERLDREEVDDLIRSAARLHAAGRKNAQPTLAASAAYLRELDAEDGGYDWGPEGPPPVR